MNSVSGKPRVVEYESDPDLRDTEQVPLLEAGGIEAFLRREVLPMRMREEIRADIVALEKETKGLLESIIEGGAS